MIGIRDAGTVILMLLLLAAPCWAAENPDGYYKKHEHQFAQDVSGDGFVMVKQEVNTETLQLQNYMHGSGSMDMATLINSSQKSHRYKYFTGTGWESDSSKCGNITLKEQNEMSYAPRSFAYGTGYYERYPVVYNSKLKEKTCGKNYQKEVGTSMHHQIEYAEGFVKDIEVNLDCKGHKKDAKGQGLVEMRIDEDVTEGVVHVGELMTNEEYGWKKPLIEIDENYVGSFKIKKNMKVTASKAYPKDDEDDWLTCCFGGYGGIDDENKKWGEEEIFNCTCRQVAWDKSGWSNLTQEQYTSDKVKVSLEGEQPVVEEEPELTIEELLEMLREKGYEGNVTIDSNETTSGNTTLV